MPRSTARKAVAAAISEAAFQRTVIEMAQALGWRVYHNRKTARPGRDGGYHTAYTGDGGFPDLVLARDGEVLIVELKSERGTLSGDQRDWLFALGDDSRVWRPSDMDEIEEALR